MITEVVTIVVKPGEEANFEAGVFKAVDVFRRATGWRSIQMKRCIEEPSRYDVIIGWDTLENHTVDFRGSALFLEWRTLVGSFFAEPPTVRHYELAMAEIQ